MVENPFDSEEEKTRQQKEFALQCHIVKKHEQYFPHVVMTAFPGRPGDAQDGFFKRMMGVKPGVTDILLWWDHQYPLWALSFLSRMLQKIGISFSRMHGGVVEIKVDARVSSSQNKFMSAIRHRGGKDGVAHSWREYYHLLCGFGIKPAFICTVFDEPDLRSKVQMKADSFDWFAP